MAQATSGASERDLAAALHRLAEQGEQKGVRIVTEWASGEHFATSATDATRIYRVTGFSCTCPGFVAWQRCQHHSLLLAELGWLPDLDPEPAPPTPLAVVVAEEGDPCLDCRSLGSIMRLGESGAWFAVPCADCGGSGRVPVDGEVIADPDNTGATGSPAVGDLATVTVARELTDGDATETGTVIAGASRPSDLPDPWDTGPAAVSSTPEATPTPFVVTEPAPEAGVAVLPAPIPCVRREDRARDLESTVEEAIATLAAQLAEGHTAGYLEVLDFYSNFHRYSLRNVLLIKAQRPEARLVAGMKQWNSLGYRIRAGERATWIWAPVKKRTVDEASGELVEQVVGFRPAPVFADNQIVVPDDRPLPSLFKPLPDDCEDVYGAAKRRVIATGIEVEEVSLPGGIQGASLGGKILLRSGLDSRTQLLILAHELAHELTHQGEEGDEKPREIRELEAESTAFVVGRILGIDNPFSGNYLLNYGLDAATLRAALATIQSLVRRVMAVIAPEQGEQEVRRAA